MLIFIDVETTSLWHFNQPLDHPDQPHLVQLAAILCDTEGTQQRFLNTVIRPNGYRIPEEATRIHGITDQYARAFGEPLAVVIGRFLEMLDTANEFQYGSIVAHNVTFDINVLAAAMTRCGHNPAKLACVKSFCTMKALTDRMALPMPGDESLPPEARRRSKWPTLDEALRFIAPDQPRPTHQRHSAMSDALACRDIYLAGRERQWW